MKCNLPALWEVTLLITSFWFREIEMLVNIALGKQAYQTGTHAGGEPQRAVDGGLSQDFYDGSCIHTSGQTDQYWEVDLGRKYSIHHVTIYNRLDSGGSRTKDVELYIGMRNDRYNLEGFHEGQIGSNYTFLLGKAVTGRWVRIARLPSMIEFLNFCEVQVYGYTYKSKFFNFHISCVMKIDPYGIKLDNEAISIQIA